MQLDLKFLYSMKYAMLINSKMQMKSIRVFVYIDWVVMVVVLISICQPQQKRKNMRSYSENQHLPWGLVPFSLFLVTSESLLSLFLVQDFNMLVSDLAGVNWLRPFIVLYQIYSCSNFGHNFSLLALLKNLWRKFQRP